jgi:hypothetical protein
MLRFSLLVSLLGMAAAIATFLRSEVAPIESPTFIYAMFGGVFLAFVPAVLGHPKTTFSGGRAAIRWVHTYRNAPWWSTALAIGSFVLMLVLWGLVPEREFSIGSAADLVGRPDRVRALLAFFNVFYAVSLHIALSGLKLQREIDDLMKAP